MDTRVKLVETADEIAQVWRARYRVYVEECGYALPTHDMMLRDAFDGLPRTGNVIVVQDGVVLAGGRVVVGLGEPLPIDGRYDFKPHLPSEPTRIAAGGFFFADPSLRGTPWPGRLLRMAHQWAFDQGARYGVVVAAPRAGRALKAAGYEQIGPAYVEAKTGLPCVPMRVDLRRWVASRPSAQPPLAASQLRASTMDIHA